MNIDKNKLVDFLLDMSVSKEKVLYNLLKDEEIIEEKPKEKIFITKEETPKKESPYRVTGFTDTIMKSKCCNTCKHNLGGCTHRDLITSGDNTSKAIVECVGKGYKYWEKR